MEIQDFALVKTLRMKINQLSKEIIFRRNKIVDELIETDLIFETLSIEDLKEKQTEIESALRLPDLGERKDKFINTLNKIKETIRNKLKVNNLESFINSEMTTRTPPLGNKTTKISDEDKISIESDPETNKIDNDKFKDVIDEEGNSLRAGLSDKHGLDNRKDIRIDDNFVDKRLKSSTRYSEDLYDLGTTRTEEERKKMNEFFEEVKRSAEDIIEI